MINKIEITNIATYRSTSVLEPKLINFVYGGNGTGKTTLSRFIADESISSDSTIVWDTSSHEKVVFYNREFADSNFSEDKALPGIFTLASESIELQNEIFELKNQQNFHREKQEKEGAVWKQYYAALEYINNNFLNELVIRVESSADNRKIENFTFVALEELLANAIVHNNYENGKPIQIYVSEKQINIVNYNKPLPLIRISDLNERTFFNE